MTSFFTSEINASSGIGTRDIRDGKGLGFPITARHRICCGCRCRRQAREYQRFVDDLKIAAEVLSKSARAA